MEIEHFRFLFSFFEDFSELCDVTTENVINLKPFLNIDIIE